MICIYKGGNKGQYEQLTNLTRTLQYYFANAGRNNPPDLLVGQHAAQPSRGWFAF